MRTETIVKKEKSELKINKKISIDEYSRKELDMMIVRLADAHELII